MSGPRPVTPVGLLAQSLDEVSRRLVDEGVRDEVERARALAEGLERYVGECTSQASPALEALERLTRQHDWGSATPLEQEMLSGHAEGRFLDFLVRGTRALRVLDVGMFTGYSALAMAQALPPSGEVVALEVDEDAAALARECFARSPVGERISVWMGPARDSLAALAGEGSPFDLIFLDADKPGYATYLGQILDGGLLTHDGLLCVDNTLMQGEPWMEDAGPNGAAIAEFNAALAADPRTEQVLVPLRDGVTLVRLAR